jgi:hypothetical protein
MQTLRDVREKGLKLDLRMYVGPKTYNQVTLNKDNMALIIAEDPMTATWLTRDFNPDLIDNAVKTFDRDWKKAKSVLDMTPEDIKSLGIIPGELVSSVFSKRSSSEKK